MSNSCNRTQRKCCENILKGVNNFMKSGKANQEGGKEGKMEGKEREALGI